LPYLCRRTWHTFKIGLATDDERRGNLQHASERSINFPQVASINAISRMEIYRERCRDRRVLAYVFSPIGD
jgi:hypothetical protein